MPDKDKPVDLEVHRISKELEPLLELKANLDIIKVSRDTILEYHAISAELRFNKFRELLDVGFTEEQALTFCQGNDFL